VEAGAREAGRTRFEFTFASVTDGIAMGHIGMKASLVSLELVADAAGGYSGDCGQGMGEDVVLVTDDRFSGGTRGFHIGIWARGSDWTASVRSPP
jgi:dihydroxyacid dehydratase/phosphogluconate dehydratase